MIGMQDNYFTYCISNGISNTDDISRLDFLTNVLKLSPEVQNDFKSTVEKNKRDIDLLKIQYLKNLGIDFN